MTSETTTSAVLVSNTRDSLTVQWSSVDGATEYKLEFGVSGGLSSYLRGWQLATESTTKCQATISDLQENTSYVVRVTAKVNDAWATPGEQSAVMRTLSLLEHYNELINERKYAADALAEAEKGERLARQIEDLNLALRIAEQEKKHAQQTLNDANVDGLKAELAELRASSTQKLADAQACIEDWTAKLEQCEKAAAEYKEELTGSLQRRTAELDQSIEKCHTLEAEVSSLQRQLSSATSDLQVHKDRVETMREAQQSSEEEHNSVVTELKERLAATQASLEAVTAEKTALDDSCVRLTEQLEALKSQLSSEQNSVSEEMGVLKEELHVTQRKLAETTASLSAVQTELATVHTSASETGARNQELCKELETLNTAHQMATGENARMSRELDAFRHESTSHQERVKIAEDAAADSARKIREFEATVAANLSDISELQSTNAEVSRELAALKEEMKQKDEAIADGRRMYEEAQAAHQEAQAQLTARHAEDNAAMKASYEERLADLSSGKSAEEVQYLERIASLNDRIERLSSMLSAKEDKLHAVQLASETKERELQECQRELARSTSAATAVSEHVQQMHDANADLKTKLREANRTLNEAAAARLQAEEENSLLNRSNRDLKHEQSLLSDRFEDLDRRWYFVEMGFDLSEIPRAVADVAFLRAEFGFDEMLCRQCVARHPNDRTRQANAAAEACNSEV